MDRSLRALVMGAIAALCVLAPAWHASPARAENAGVKFGPSVRPEFSEPVVLASKDGVLEVTVIDSVTDGFSAIVTSAFAPTRTPTPVRAAARSQRPAAIAAIYARVRRSGSPPVRTSVITATAAAPAEITVAAFSSVMPPIATTGLPRSAAYRTRSRPRAL